MDLNTWLLYLLAAVGLSLSPGPNGLLALTHGALHGRRKTLYTVAGGAVGEAATEVFIASMAQRISPWPERVGRRFNQACGAVFIAIGAALPLRP